MTSQVETSTQLEGVSLIGGDSVVGQHGTITAVNPRTGTPLGPDYGLVGPADVDRAVQLAGKAFASYRKTTPEVRGDFLETIAANIEDLGSALTERVCAESGLPEARVQGETVRTANQLRLFASVVREGNFQGARIDPALPERTPLPRVDLRMRKIPVGPVAVFGASNFPLAFSVAGGDTASALAAGSPVVVKAHSAHPGTSELVGRAVASAVAEHHLHPGVFSLLFGRGSSIGNELVTHPGIKAVGFTGSRSGGLALAKAAAERSEPIPVYAEMSSINPVFVLEGALASGAGDLGAAWVGSVTTGVGQLCTSPGLVFVAEGPGMEEFISGAAEAVQQMVGAPMLTAGIAEAFNAGAQTIRDHGGVKLIAEGSPAADIISCGVPQLYVTEADTFLEDDALQAEIFGPASVVVTVRDSRHMAEVLDSLEGQLTVTIHADGTEAGVADLMDAAELRAGRVLFNGWPTGVEVGHAMVHGGPFPATTNTQTTSVGSFAVERFLRPVAYQNVPGALLPEAVQDRNPLGLWRQRDGQLTRD